MTADRLLAWALGIQSGDVDLTDPETAISLCSDLAEAAVTRSRAVAVELKRRRNLAVAALLTDEAINYIAGLVASYYPEGPDGPEPTAHDIACQTLSYLADTVAPLISPT